MTFNPQPKTGKPKNGTAAGLRHMGRVKSLPCVICGIGPPSDAHHCRSGGQMRDDFKVIPLCKIHHLEYHARKATWHETYGLDKDYLPVVADMLAGEFNG